MKTFMLTPLLAIFLLAAAFGQQRGGNRDFKNSFVMYPLNYAHIDLGRNDGVQGMHMGISFQRVLDKNKKIILSLPLVTGIYGIVPIYDYYKEGGQVYILPGVKYYPKGFDRIKGFSFGTHLLLGYDSYTYNSWSTNGNQKASFAGLLFNTNYCAKLRSNVGLDLSAGIGYRYYRGKLQRDYLNDFNQQIRATNPVEKHGHILNLSVGLLFFL